MALQQDQGISTFEFINSGVAEALVGYLTYGAPASASYVERLAATQVRGQRLRHFTEMMQRNPQSMAILIQVPVTCA